MITGFIGAGRAGCSIGKYLSQKGIPLAGFYDLSKEEADSAAEFTASKSFASVQDLIATCSLVFLTTPDGIIPKAWEMIRACPLEGKIICHCSGALTADAFTGIEQAHAYGCSLHPMLPFNSRFSSSEILEHAFFTIEGHPKAVKEVSKMFTGLGNTVCPIDRSCKPKYHAAASILSNQVTAVLDTGYRLLEECGFTREDAIHATKTLVLQNIENVLQYDCVQSLTGPIERGDIQTVQKHINCLEQEDKSMYQVLGLKLVKIAKKKHPQKDYGKLKDYLENLFQKKCGLFQ